MQTILKSYLWILLVFPSFFVDAQAVLEIECNVLKAQMLKGENPNLKNEFSTFFLEKELIPNVWGKYKFKKGLTSSVTFENIPYGTYRVTIVKNQNQKKSKTVINRNDVKNINRKKNLEKVDVYISNIIQFDKANTAFPCNDKPTLQQNFSSEKELGNFTFYPNLQKKNYFLNGIES